MLNCKQASALMSRTMDETLPLGKRLALRLHLFICDGCTNFFSQITLLRKASRAIGSCQHCEDLTLSDEARKRISHALEEAKARKENDA